MVVIYKILNTKNNKFYIGSAQDFERRTKQHLLVLRKNKHYNVHLQRSFNKYGEQNFQFLVLEELPDENTLIEREQHWIDTLNPYYNINKVANSSIGVKRREETKEKIRAANLGLVHPEWRNKLKSECMSGDKHWTKKHKISDEGRKALSDGQKRLYASGYQNPNKRKIQQFTLEGKFVKEYPSITEASRELNIERRTISACVNRKSKTSGGFLWQFSELM